MESKYTISKEDQSYIDSGIDDADKLFRKNVIQAAIDLNGANDAAQPGVAVSYIPEDNYYVRVSLDAITDNQLEIYEQALNWNALGRGKGGLAGAAVRWKLRSFFVKDRETKEIKILTPEHAAIVKEYIAYLAINRPTSAVWFSNGFNVLGLATSCFIRESHHWDSNNVRPIKALLGSLNQENEIPESEYRKLFYLSIHPIPLDTFALVFFKSLDPLDRDISATVKTRLNVAPAGYADVCACAIAAESFLHEDFARRCTLLPDILRVVAGARALKADPISYHPFASSMGMERKDLIKSNLTEAMIVLGAYAKSCIGGTLANSPALIKFLDLHARKVAKLTRGFAEYNERKSEDLIRILTGEDSKDLEVVSDKIRPLAKLAEKLKNMSDDQNSAVFKASLVVEDKIANVVTGIGNQISDQPVDIEKALSDFKKIPFKLSLDLVEKFKVDGDTIARVSDTTARKATFDV